MPASDVQAERGTLPPRKDRLWLAQRLKVPTAGRLPALQILSIVRSDCRRARLQSPGAFKGISPKHCTSPARRAEGFGEMLHLRSPGLGGGMGGFHA
jgi:hypothetical protein